jgi:hypothetical protein
MNLAFRKTVIGAAVATASLYSATAAALPDEAHDTIIKSPIVHVQVAPQDEAPAAGAATDPASADGSPAPMLALASPLAGFEQAEALAMEYDNVTGQWKVKNVFKSVTKAVSDVGKAVSSAVNTVGHATSVNLQNAAHATSVNLKNAAQATAVNLEHAGHATSVNLKNAAHAHAVNLKHLPEAAKKVQGAIRAGVDIMTVVGEWGACGATLGLACGQAAYDTAHVYDKYRDALVTNVAHLNHATCVNFGGSGCKPYDKVKRNVNKSLPDLPSLPPVKFAGTKLAR